MLTFVKSPYMTWAKTAGQGCTHFLSRSGIQPPPAEWLGPLDVEAALNFTEIYGDSILREQLANRYGVRPSQVLTSVGASEGNFLMLAALVEAGMQVALETPRYELLKSTLEALGVSPVPLERTAEEGYQLQPERVLKLLAQGVRGFVVTDLHNPTGVATPLSVYETLAEPLERAGAWMLVDEIYLDFMLEQRRPTAAQISKAYCVTSSLTKVYGLSSLRCGWGFGPESVIERAYDVRDHVGVVASGPAVLLARSALGGLDRLLAWSAWRAASGRAVMESFMRRTRHLSWVKPEAGIVGLVRLPPGLSGTRVSDYLAEQHHVLVTPGEFFDAPGTLRVGFGGDPEPLEYALTHLERALDELTQR